MPGKDSADAVFVIKDANAQNLAVLEKLTEQISDSIPLERLSFETCADADMAFIHMRTVSGDLIQTIELSKPVRAGRMLDTVLTMHKQQGKDGNTEIAFGDWVLNTAFSTLKIPSGDVVKLTEKEVAILKYLHVQDGDVAKDELLRAVWEYAEDVETHTLETHIYRLRQKIEDDPANPRTVVTTDNGYRLKV